MNITVPNKLGPAGTALIEANEGCKLTAYPDPKTGGDPWTIARGHTGPEVHAGMTCTQAQADAWFEADMAKFIMAVHLAVKVPLSQNQFDAMVSIVENVGPGSQERDGILRLKSGNPSTLLRLLNLGDYKGAANEFPKWCSPGSSVERGLKIRRLAEQALFMKL